MADCSKTKNVLAGMRARQQLTGDIMSEAQRIASFDGEQRAFYEIAMENLTGKKSKRSVHQDWSAIKSKVEPKGFKAANGFYGRPSQLLSKRFYDGVMKPINAFEKSFEGKKVNGKPAKPTLKDYNAGPGKQFKTLLKAIDTVSSEHAGKPSFASALKPLGIKPAEVYHAREWVQWLSKGGALMPPSNDFIKAANAVGGNVAKAQANWQMLWTAGNGVDMIKLYSHYVTRKPDSLLRVLKATGEAIADNPFTQSKKLEKLGVYGTDYLDRGGKSPFDVSITIQKNIAYYLDKAHDGDGLGGIRDQLFDSNQWDRPMYDRSPDTKLLSGLARYPIAETRWYAQTMGKVLTGDMRELANMLVYHAAKGAVVGVKSLVPAGIWYGLSKEQKQSVEKLEKQLGTNLIARNLKIDLSQYTQPGGGSYGARAQSLITTGQKITGNLTKAVSRGADGKLGAAAASALASAMALQNLSGWNAGGNALLEGANSTTFQKMMETTSDFLAGTLPKKSNVGKELIKDAFGATFKPDEQKSTKLKVLKPKILKPKVLGE